MSFVYVVEENGEVYEEAYGNYYLAIRAVHAKHNEEIEKQEREASELDMESCSEVIVPENNSGKTRLYIEKGIIITILKLRVLR